MRRLVIDSIALACLTLALWSGCSRLNSAPYLPRPAKVRPLSRAALVGTWICRWGQVPCTMTLSPEGDYSCVWCGTRYVGTWGWTEGRFWITEAIEGGNHWEHYAVRLQPGTLSGPVVHGAPGVRVKLRRRP